MAVKRTIRIDPVACDGYGHCAEIAPELFALDEWGYPIIRSPHTSAQTNALAELAVRQCPRRAISLVEAVAPPTRRR
jgi:ferredoxin